MDRHSLKKKKVPAKEKTSGTTSYPPAARGLRGVSWTERSSEYLAILPSPTSAGSFASSPHPQQLRSPSGRLHDRTGKPSADCRVPFAAKNGHLLYNNFSFKLTIPGNLLPCVCSPFDTTKAELPLACEYDLLSKVNVEGSTRRVQTRYQMHLE